MEPRHSIRWLAYHIGVEVERLEAFAGEAERHYHSFLQRKKSGSTRQIDEPSPELKDIQRRIVSKLLRDVPLPQCVQGSARGRSPLSNAKLHMGQRCVVRIDIRDFFPRVTNKRVYAVWSDVFQFGRSLARILTQLTTLKGHVPQGAPTSSFLANLCLVETDKILEKRAAEVGVRYTRYVDDVVLSGERAREMIQVVIREMSRAGFPCHRREKLRVQGAAELQVVTGYGVNNKRVPSVPREHRDRVAAGVHELRMKRLRGSASPELEKSVQGRIAYVRQTNPGTATRLQRRLNKPR